MTNETPGATLCKSCGLCCTGHLFTWTKLRSAELDGIQSLGLKVFREPDQRGFNQPCPLWDGVCTIYTSPDYPNFCRTFKCKLLKELINESITLPSALPIVQETKTRIADLETLMPASPNPNFRERLLAHIDQKDAGVEFRRRAKELLAIYDSRFGVSDLYEDAGMGAS